MDQNNMSVQTIVNSSESIRKPEIGIIRAPEQIDEISRKLLPPDLLSGGFRVNRTVFLYPYEDRLRAKAHGSLYASVQARATIDSQRRGGRNNSCLLIEAYGNQGEEHQIFFAGQYANASESRVREINDATNFQIREANSIIAGVGGDYIMEEIG